MVQYSTALSHIFLAGTGLYCLKALSNYRLPFSRLPFVLIVVHSLLGVWRWGNPSYGYKIEKIYRLTSKIQDLLVLPCIVSILWLKYKYSFPLASAHTLLSLVPLILYVYDNRKSEPVDAFLGGNLLSLMVVSYFNDNLYGINTSISYLLSYFFIKQDVIHNLPIDIPTQDLFDYSMCFFAFFALRAILEPVY